MNEEEQKRVLIVEDEMVIAMDLASGLRQLGYAVVGHVQTAKQAIHKTGELHPDLVLMDIQLKGHGDGVTAAATIRECWDVPVVFVTANINSEVVERVKGSGSYGFLSKPFRPRELDATLSIALRQHKLSRELFAERSWFTTTLCSLSDGVIAADATGHVRFMNPAAENLTGWSAADAKGLPIEAVYPLSTMENRPVMECQLRKALLSRAPIGKQRFLMQVKGNGKVPVEDSASPIFDGGHLLGAVTIFLDVSDRIWKEREDIEEREQLTEQAQLATEALGNTRGELQALSHHLMTAQEQERTRIARELHDDLGQRTALLGMKVNRLHAKAPAGLDHDFDSLRFDLTQLANSLREVSHKLYPSAISDLGLATAIQALVDDLRAQNVKIQLKVETRSQLSPEASTALYRIVQEALQNARKYAPKALVTLRLWQEGESILLSVRDSGTGFSLAEVRGKGGLGLISMQERARLAGGTLKLTSEPGEGTEVLVQMPL